MYSDRGRVEGGCMIGKGTVYISNHGTVYWSGQDSVNSDSGDTTVEL